MNTSSTQITHSLQASHDGAFITVGETSDFEDNTTQGWTVGNLGNHPAPPTNIPDGGPDGVGDNFLQTQSSSGYLAGSRLAWFNSSAAWTGNYTEVGVTAIAASVINQGNSDVVLRVAFDGSGGRFVTTEGITVSPGDDWQDLTFDITASDLTAVGGSDVDATLSNVSQIRFLNNTDTAFQGEETAAQVGIDNIKAMGEATTIDDDGIIDDSNILDTAFNRFQNSTVPGTYVYATGAEADAIRANSPGFVDEGVAFNAAIAFDDDLIALTRLENNQLPGTFLYVGDEELASINADPNLSNDFTNQGIAFYVYGTGAGEETPFNRFQNSDVPGTYLYATGAEADAIRANFPSFIDEGVAFEVLI